MDKLIFLCDAMVDVEVLYFFVSQLQIPSVCPSVSVEFYVSDVKYMLFKITAVTLLVSSILQGLLTL